MHVDLDHVALATRDVGAAIRTMTGALGGLVVSGGTGAGFRAVQVHLGDGGSGMRVELLEPWDVAHNDFLDRFLSRHGEGPHHLTFKVDSLDDALERVRSAGFTPVAIDRSEPSWQEAFLLPRESNGTVIQLAETVELYPSRAARLEHVRRHGPDGWPRWWPDPPAAHAPPATLERVVVRTHHLESALALFAGLLHGMVEHESAGSVDLVWPGGARLRLVVDGTAAPGIDHLRGHRDGASETREVIGTPFVLEPR